MYLFWCLHLDFLVQQIIFLVDSNFQCLDWHQPGPIKSVLLVMIGWLVCWLVDNAVFSETALRIFLVFGMKLGDYIGRKVAEPDF